LCDKSHRYRVIFQINATCSGRIYPTILATIKVGKKLAKTKRLLFYNNNDRDRKIAKKDKRGLGKMLVSNIMLEGALVLEREKVKEFVK